MLRLLLLILGFWSTGFVFRADLLNAARPVRVFGNCKQGLHQLGVHFSLYLSCARSTG